MNQRVTVVSTITGRAPEDAYHLRIAYKDVAKANAKLLADTEKATKELTERFSLYEELLATANTALEAAKTEIIAMEILNEGMLKLYKRAHEFAVIQGGMCEAQWNRYVLSQEKENNEGDTACTV
jgi:hypothetical protein